MLATCAAVLCTARFGAAGFEKVSAASLPAAQRGLRGAAPPSKRAFWPEEWPPPPPVDAPTGPPGSNQTWRPAGAGPSLGGDGPSPAVSATGSPVLGSPSPRGNDGWEHTANGTLESDTLESNESEIPPFDPPGAPPVPTAVDDPAARGARVGAVSFLVAAAFAIHFYCYVRKRKGHGLLTFADFKAASDRAKYVPMAAKDDDCRINLDQPC
ncbi:hypothetical protein DIPPA_06100 [Diplonema papillatum]|nr:hypothetical protein DIPPA_06100 [Diplonema papillatum]